MNQLFRNREGKFELDDQPPLRIVGRANGGVFPSGLLFDGAGSRPLRAAPEHTRATGCCATPMGSCLVRARAPASRD